MGEEKRLVLIFVEGDTEVEFYKRLIQEMRAKAGGRLSCKVEIKNVKGVGHYKNTVSRIYKKKIKPENPDAKIDVFLSYDTDVFELKNKPPVNWEEVISELNRQGANSVHQIEAKSSIEDWFLFDIEGIRSFLKIKKKQRLTGYKGLEGLKAIFRLGNKTYVKGNNSNGLVDSLNMSIIFPKICDQIRELCLALGLNCTSENRLCR